MGKRTYPTAAAAAAGRDAAPAAEALWLLDRLLYTLNCISFHLIILFYFILLIIIFLEQNAIRLRAKKTLN